MPSVKQFAGYLVAGAVVSGFFVDPAQAQDRTGFSMGRLAPIPLQTRADGSPSFVFQQTGAQTTQFKAYLDGFLFCANITNPDSTPSTTNLKLVPAHEDQSFEPAHPWLFPDVVDIATFSYSGGRLSIPESVFGPTLACRSTDATGQVPSATSEGIFDNAFESTTATNFAHLINWKAPRGFDWSAPDWSQVPTDACAPTVDQPAAIVEDSACVAVTGIRRDDSGNLVRSASMWTTTDGVSLTYLFRVEARLGPQTTGQQTVFQIPTAADTGTTGAGYATVSLREAFENGDDDLKPGVGYLAKTGQYCLLTELPTVLNSSVCANAPTHDSLPLPASFTLGQPPIYPGVNQAFYVVVTRPIKGTHGNTQTPVVGVAALLEPAVASEGGDKFVGDDIVFGFMPTSAGFPWMRR